MLTDRSFLLPSLRRTDRLIIEKELFNETSFRKRMFDVRVVEERSKFIGTPAEWGDLFVELLMQAGRYMTLSDDE